MQRFQGANGPTINTVLFSPTEHLPLEIVQRFECGDDVWASLAAEWIKNAPPFASAAKSITDHGTKVWLHKLDDCLVGFSSLGKNRWNVPPPEGPLQHIGYVPMVAVNAAFQGKSDGNRKYSHIIIDHIIAEARQSYSKLGLLVNPENVTAMKLYETFGFINCGSYKNGQIAMMLDLT
ncbi:GNAT family N-acetyltransferase [Planctomycetota bacterium]